MSGFFVSNCCERCQDADLSRLPFPRNLARHMDVCSECGNKRCPKARWHGYQCTGSNASGQVPSLPGDTR